MHTVRWFIVTAISAGCLCWSADLRAEPVRSLLEFGIPNFATSRQRAAKGVAGRIAALPAVGTLVARIEALAATAGFPVGELAKGMQAYEIRSLAQRVPWTIGPETRLEDMLGAMSCLKPRDETAGRLWSLHGRPSTITAGWLIWSGNVALPFVPSRPPDGGADAWMRIMVGELAAYLAPQDPRPKGAPAPVCITVRSWIEAEGTREEIQAPGTAPSGAPLAMKELEALPERPLLLAVAGLDGSGAALLITVCRSIPGLRDVITELDRALAAKGSEPFALQLAKNGGTMWLALTAGSPLPAMTLVLPAGPASDVIADLMDKGKLGEADRRSTWMMPVPLPYAPMMTDAVVRRTPTRLVISTDLALAEAIATGRSGGFAQGPVPNRLAALRGNPAAPVALVWQDNETMARYLAAGLALAARGAAPEARPLLGDACHSLLIAAPFLPPSLLWIERDAAGMQGHGRNSVVFAASLGLMGIATALWHHRPVAEFDLVQKLRRLNETPEDKRRQRLQVLLEGIKQMKYNEYPRKLDEVAQQLAKYRDPPIDFMRAPATPADLPLPHYCYVRPRDQAPVGQPVIVEHPACSDGRGSLVLHLDGRIEFQAGDRYWRAAERLSRLPKGRQIGFVMADWETALAEAAPKP